MKQKNILSSLKGIAIGVVAVCTAYSVKAQSYSYKSVKGDPMQSRIYTLKNGLKVFVSVNKEKPRVQAYIAVRTGSRNDPAETTGLAHYLEHLMFKGTTHYGTSNYAAEKPLLDDIEKRYEEYRKVTNPILRKKLYHEIDSVSQLAAKYNIPNEYDKMMAGIGGVGTNAYTSNDITCYHVDIPSNELDTWAKIEGDRFQNMVIRGFHTELEAVYEEYNIGLAKDGRKMFTALMAKLFPNHPYGTQTTIGVGDHLKNPSITNIKKYFKKYYVPNNVAICLAGDIDPDKAVASIEKYFGTWKGYGEVRAPQYPALTKMIAPVDTTIYGKEAAYVAMAWRAEAAKNLQNDTLMVIKEMLNNGTAGIFDLNLNSKMRLQYAQASASTLNDYSSFEVFGSPNKGQSLEDVRRLMLSEIDKLKKGDFADYLVSSVINNIKRDVYKSLESNDTRCSYFVDAFINNIPWEQKASTLERIAKMTKSEIVSFANRFFTSNFVTVFKEQGEDNTIKKVEKPAITPIPTNNDKQSDFIKEVKNIHVDPIKPVFVNYKKDLTITKTKRGLPLLYKKNTQDDLFQLTFVLPIGTENNNKLWYASNYIDYLGTNKLSNEQIKQKLYKLACEYGIYVTRDRTYIKLYGLNENLPEVLKVVNDLMDNAKVDKQAYDKYVSSVEKNRLDEKKSQRSNFNALFAYASYGAYNGTTNRISVEELRKMNPQELLSEIKKLKSYEHTIMYYGPSSITELNKVISKSYQSADVKHLAKVPTGKPYIQQLTTKNEVLLAPYDAKNIYMMQIHNEGVKWQAQHLPIITLFNEYFGGSMNAIVFQELREARGLAYSASASYASPERPEDSEKFYTYIITQNDKMSDCINEFNNLLNNIPEREVNVDVAKQSVMKRIASRRVTKFNILNSYLNAKRFGLDKDITELVYEELPKLSLKDIVDFAKKYIANKPYKYIILGNEKELDMKALEKIAPVQHISTEQLFGENNKIINN